MRLLHNTILGDFWKIHYCFHLVRLWIFIKTGVMQRSHYIVNLPMMILTVWSADGPGAETLGNALADWQGGWTIFYWA
jgi:choline-glycine betaine transporter